MHGYVCVLTSGRKVEGGRWKAGGADVLQRMVRRLPEDEDSVSVGVRGDEEGAECEGSGRVQRQEECEESARAKGPPEEYTHTHHRRRRIKAKG